MELQISQSFKVQWLNTTLKFIKDDTQLVKDYPQMPSSHVEYLHNLIWHRKNDVGLGFKSLYSPVWEAMKIYSLKYNFKIFVEKSEDGMDGYLKMEKIPKTGQPAKKLNDQKKDTKNNDENKKRDNETIQNYEVIKKSQTEAVKYKHSEPHSSNKTKTKKPKPQMSKGLKRLMENQQMLDSLSPLFIKNTLKAILGFITDELSASKIFSNLAPIESRFLENILSICERKHDLEVLLSPACNEILMEISNCFEVFSKTCRLDISSVEMNSNTNKREVKYTKVPVFSSKQKAKQKLKENSIQTKPISPNDTTKLIKEQYNITEEKNVSKETKKSKSNILQNNAVSEDRYANSVPIDKVMETVDKNVIEALSTFVKKADDFKPTTTIFFKDTNLNKRVSLPMKSISFTKEASSSTADIPIRVVQQSPKMKILQDMTVPLNSDKAVRVSLPMKSISFTKEASSSTADIPIRVVQPSPKMKILQDTTVHLNSDKAVRVSLPMKSISFTKEASSSTADIPIRVAQPSPKMKILQDTTVHLNSDKAVSIPKKSISFKKERTSSTADTPSIRVNQKSPKMKILQDMTLPINSDKAVSQNYEVIKKSQTEEVKYEHSEPHSSNKTKTTKPIPQMSKGLKRLMENQQMLDSLSPLFIKNTLKAILGFITDELSASKIFSNLAPIESRFLENILSICKRKKYLEVLLSPACNEILMEISNCFKVFSKTCCLDISSVEMNSNTNKREVKYTKVPVFSSKQKAKQKLKENSIQTKPISPNDTTKLIKEQYNITKEKNVSKETKKSKSNILQNNAVSEDRYANSVPIDKVMETVDKNVIEALSTFVKKAEVKPKTTTYLKDTSLNKSVFLPTKSISFTKEGTSSTADTPYIRVDQKSYKMKILQDMTVPINSDKAVKMMQLMGWKGGALGLRGDGITEPIIPKPNYNACGLGHVSVRKDFNKETKKHIRCEFVNKILNMIDNNIKMSVIKLQNQLNKQEIRFLKLTLQAINNRANMDAELEKRLEIEDKMIRDMDIIFNMDFEDNKRKIIITKTSKTEMKAVNQDTKREANSKEIDINAIRNRSSEAKFKTTVLKAILKLLKSEDNEKVIILNKEGKAKHINDSSIIIQLINEGQHVQHKNSPVVAELGSKVLEAIGDILLSVKIYESERYIVIRKRHAKSNINKEIIKTIVSKAENDENNNSAFDNVRGHLKNKKKFKLLNALYKYEMDHTEGLKEKQWYNTVDRSLLDSEQMSKVIKDTQEERK